MKKAAKNKYAIFTKIEREFDYHCIKSKISSQEIEKITQDFIKNCKSDKIKIARLIVGKGNHSKNGAKIKPCVIEYLEYLKNKNNIRDYNMDNVSMNGNGLNTGAIIIKI